MNPAASLKKDLKMIIPSASVDRELWTKQRFWLKSGNPTNFKEAMWHRPSYRRQDYGMSTISRELVEGS
jgi:hypothetical protein